VRDFIVCSPFCELLVWYLDFGVRRQESCRALISSDVVNYNTKIKARVFLWEEMVAGHQLPVSHN
jgi:hypothetical protein